MIILKDFFILHVSIIVVNRNKLGHRPPTEVIQYSMETSCPEDFKKYKTIPVVGRRAEQFANKVDRVYRDLQQ